MPTTFINGFRAEDVRFALQPGEGADAVHSHPQYSFAVTYLHSSADLVGTGLVLTMGASNGVVCDLISLLAPPLVGLEIETPKAPGSSSDLRTRQVALGQREKESSATLLQGSSDLTTT